VDFFDQIGSLMIQSKVQVEKLAVCSDDNYLIEYQHIKTNRNDGINIDHYWCVLWKFDHNKICEGRHLAGDQYAIDDFLTKITSVSRKKTKKTAKEPVTLH
jgi:uridine kinase